MSIRELAVLQALNCLQHPAPGYKSPEGAYPEYMPVSADEIADFLRRECGELSPPPTKHQVVAALQALRGRGVASRHRRRARRPLVWAENKIETNDPARYGLTRWGVEVMGQ